jgi:hypothetical protein
VTYRGLYLAVLFGIFALVLAAPAVAQDKNCEDFPNQAAAQQALRADPTDPEGLDGPPGAGFAGIKGVACEQLPAPKDIIPVLPNGSNDVGPLPGGTASQVGGPLGGGSQASTEDNRELLDAGGNLPLPDKAASDNAHTEATDDGSPWPWGPASLILLCTGLLVFAVVGLSVTGSRTELRSWLYRFFFGP